MITIKKRHNLIIDDDFNELLNKFNNVVRYSYNRRVKDNLTKLSDIEKYVKLNMKNIESLDASWIKCAVKKASELHINDDKLYFGGKSNFFKEKFKKINLKKKLIKLENSNDFMQKSKINNEIQKLKEFNLNKNMPLEMRGSSTDPNGNRKAKLINNKVIFKPFRGKSYEIELKLSKNELKMLNSLEKLINLKQSYFNIEINNEFFWISFNEPVLETHKFKKNRYLGIDLNPNWIAISIMDNGIKCIHKELVDLRLLNKEDKNKKIYELSILNKHIIGLCKNFGVEFVCLEELVISSKDNNLGKYYNRLVNNDWCRNFIISNLVKLMNISSIKFIKVNPFYTSFMGQVKNNCDYDSLAASKEVAYRGYLEKNRIKVNDYVKEFLGGEVTTQWKDMLNPGSTFKDLYDHFKTKKKSKNSYRFLFNDVEKLKWSSLRLKSNKSKIDLIRF